mgnify:CR=1 FL=1
MLQGLKRLYVNFFFCLDCKAIKESHSYIILNVWLKVKFDILWLIVYIRFLFCLPFTFHLGSIWLHLNFWAPAIQIIYAPNKYFLIMCIYLNFISTSLVCIDIQCYTPYCLQRMATKKPISSLDRVERNLRYLCPEAMLFWQLLARWKNTTTDIIFPTYVKP